MQYLSLRDKIRAESAERATRYIDDDAATIADAIATSIQEDRIVHLEWTPGLAEALEIEADDSADTDAVVEYWGTLGGADWRVHLNR